MGIGGGFSGLMELRPQGVRTVTGWRARPVATQDYVIHFTPRSGSSWLTDLLRATDRLSQPGESFNPVFVPRIAASHGVETLPAYVDSLRRRRNTDGVFGAQTTHYHIRRTFGSGAMFHRYFRQAAAFWLIREDIVAQAISLSRKQQTGVGHQTGGAGGADCEFIYDGPGILRWLRHIRAAEFGSEAHFRRYGIDPVRMSYERMMQMPPKQVVVLFLDRLGLADDGNDVPPSRHQKLRDPRNQAYAARFRAENARVVDKVRSERAAMLAKLPHSSGPILAS